MLLENKHAVVYGAGGGIGRGVSLTFAREGARIFLAGRTRDKLERLAEEITAAGGYAEVAVVDALDENAVNDHMQAVASRAGSIDILLNLITRGDVQGIPLIDMTPTDLTRAVVTGLTAQFLTARAAARQMIAQGSGVILMLTSGTSARGDTHDGQHGACRCRDGSFDARPGGWARTAWRPRAGHLDCRCA